MEELDIFINGDIEDESLKPKKTRKKRELTPEQKEALVERLKRGREKSLQKRKKGAELKKKAIEDIKKQVKTNDEEYSVPYSMLKDELTSIKSMLSQLNIQPKSNYNKAEIEEELQRYSSPQNAESDNNLMRIETPKIDMSYFEDDDEDNLRLVREETPQPVRPEPKPKTPNPEPVKNTEKKVERQITKTPQNVRNLNSFFNSSF